jgi:S-adenosylmethionine:tRNA ribosyltransferase-isomerase
VSDELAEYDYDLPEHLIARHPAAHREDARLMVLDRAAGTIEHRGVRDLPKLLRAGDCLVLNDTRVVKARLIGRRRETGGRWEGLFLETTGDGNWRMIGQTRGKLRPGEQLVVSPAHDSQSTDALVLELIDRDAEGIWTLRPIHECEPMAALERFGTVPLPPYMDRELAEADDFERYQTTYARHPGSVAAPTAGLHFTPELLAACASGGIEQAFVTLHVGIGTFRPIVALRLADHKMHSEWCEVPAETAKRLTRVRERNGRIVAVGTTSTRTLETAARAGESGAWRGSTDLFIRPPFRFGAVDVLLTNFHLPRSTLLVLVSTFAGRDLIRKAYAEAIRERYRFYSYGDAMLIV